MTREKPVRVGYVLKVYPRLSQTFIVNEILAHEAAGLELAIFSLRQCTEEHLHEALSRVRAPVTYLPYGEINADQFWAELRAAAAQLPDFWAKLEGERAENAGDVYQALLLAKAARNQGLTHLHAHFGNAATTVARLAACFAGIPYSFTAHARDIFHEKVVAEQLERKLNEAQSVITVSEFNLKYLHSSFRGSVAKVRRVYNGLDLERFAYRAPDSRAPVIISVGRLIEKKGFQDLINACSVLKTRGRPFRCLIVGSGELQGTLAAQIAQLGLAEEVEMLGARSQEEVMRLVQQAAVFAAPCVIGGDGDRDGLPTVLLEAMALGTPCISTAVTGIPEIVRHEDTGLIVPQRNAQALADALERLLDEPSLRVCFAANARRLIESEFDIHHNAARVREIFAERRAA